MLHMMPYKKCALNFIKQHFEKIYKIWLFSNHRLCRLVPCISMKLGTFVKWPFLLITSKSARICLNVFGDPVIQSLKSENTRKSGLVPMSRKAKLADWFLVIPTRLETWPKVFYSYSFIKRSRNEAFRHFFVNFLIRLPWKRWPLEKFWLQFWLCISKFYDCTKFHCHQVAGEKVINDQSFQFFCFWPP